MQPVKAATNAAKFFFDELEELGASPTQFIDEARPQIDGFFNSARLGARPHEIARGELAHAREEQHLKEKNAQDKHHSEEKALQIQEILANYKEFRIKEQNEQSEVKKEVAELTEEVVKLAQASGVDTKVHLENQHKKVGKIDIKLLTFVIKVLRVKAEQSKSAKDMVSERQQIRTTGMNAWVSGKQMKIHEQGTMTLQG